MAMYNAFSFANPGINPFEISIISGLAINNCIKKDIPIIATKEIIKASNFLIPAFNKKSKTKLSRTVIQTPPKIGIEGNNK